MRFRVPKISAASIVGSWFRVHGLGFLDLGAVGFRNHGSQKRRLHLENVETREPYAGTPDARRVTQGFRGSSWVCPIDRCTFRNPLPSEGRNGGT